MAKSKQLDLFLTLSPSVIPNKSNRELMERCWFDLSKQNKTRKTLEHTTNDGKCSVKIYNTMGYGLATIYDMDLLVFITSLLMDRRNKGVKITSRKITFTGYEYFYFTGKSRSGRSDIEFQESLERLHTTKVETTIRSENKRKGFSSFYWVSEWKKVEENKRVVGYSVVIPEWIYDGVTDPHYVLTLDDEYFHIKGGLTRFLYLLCRKARDKKTVTSKGSKSWTESFESIYKKSGMVSPKRSFVYRLRKIISKQSVPNYYLEENENETLTISRTRGSYHLNVDQKVIDINSKEDIDKIENSPTLHPDIYSK
jgi:plasmid replication initiation protein